MSKIKYTFQAVITGTIEINDADSAWAAQDIVSGFVREAIAQPAGGVTITGTSSAFTEQAPSPMDQLLFGQGGEPYGKPLDTDDKKDSGGSVAGTIPPTKS